MAGHTPRPWFVHKEPTGFGEFSHIITDSEKLDDDGGAPICAVMFTNDAEPNAKLIRSAPDLRAFIEKWRKVIDGASPTAEAWAIQFEEEAAALLDGGK